MIHGRACWQQAASTGTDLTGIAAIASGLLLLFGYLTPFVSLSIGLAALAASLNLLPPCDPTPFDSPAAIGFGFSILAAILVLGPGAFSVDAIFFGRREIIIPPRT